MAFDKIYRGADMRPLSVKEIKAFVMRSRGINSDEYQKLYDRTRNKVRNYEKITGQQIGSVSHYLYTLELDKQTGREHYQSRQKDLIEHAPTISTGSSREKIQKAYDPYIDFATRRDFARLIEEDPKSKRLADTLQGQKLKDALSDRAQDISEARKKKKQAIDGDDDIFDDTDYAFSYSEV